MRLLYRRSLSFHNNNRQLGLLTLHNHNRCIQAPVATSASGIDTYGHGHDSILRKHHQHQHQSSCASFSTRTRVHLPTFGQNGTLILRSDSPSSNIAQVQIVSQWRDDAMLELVPLPLASGGNEDGHNNGNGASTSTSTSTVDDGGADADPSEIVTFGEDASDSSTQTTTVGQLQITNHADGIATSLGRKGSLIEVNVLSLPNSSSENQQAKGDNNNNTEDGFGLTLQKLIATVPEKSNITCQLLSHDAVLDHKNNNGTDIEVIGKLEGDTHLSTSHGNIVVSKLRGHNVTLDTTNTDASKSNKNSSKGIIHVRKAIEARSVKITTSKRVRAQMLNGSDVHVSVNVVINAKDKDEEALLANNNDESKLDEDDEGALIDVGSLYVSNGSVGEGGASDNHNEARLIVDNSNSIQHEGGLVRVKSSHGHVTVHATTDNNIAQSTMDDGNAPLIDLGGVNGSCDVLLESSSSRGDNDNDDGDSSNNNSDTQIVSTRVHFDSMSPESISTITSRGTKVGNNSTTSSITMDRKLEAEVRLLSVANSRCELPSEKIMDVYSLTSDEMEEIESVLGDVDAHLQQQQCQVRGDVNMDDDGHAEGDAASKSILIETDAYRGKWGVDAIGSEGSDSQAPLSNLIEYTQGTMKNRSGEPDSRFDVRSRGKINIDGAASQALHGFQGKKQQHEGTTTSSGGLSSLSAQSMPLLAVATDGRIKLETLSWFGSIARRYGLEEEDATRRVGRQASGLPRLDKE